MKSSLLLCHFTDFNIIHHILMVSRGSKVWECATCWLGTPREPALSMKWERLAKPLAVDLTASGEYTIARCNLSRPPFPRPENIESEGHHPSSNRQKSWHSPGRLLESTAQNFCWHGSLLFIFLSCQVDFITIDLGRIRQKLGSRMPLYILFWSRRVFDSYLMM